MRVRVLALMAIGLVAAGAAPPKTPDLKKPFSHDTHLKERAADADRKMGCADCHEIGVDEAGRLSVCAETRMPFPKHAACAPCHKTAFFKKPLLICTNCHTASTFEAQPPMKAQTGEHAPLRALFNHRLHNDAGQRVRTRFGLARDCTFCHRISKTTRPPRLPAHDQCCLCHTKEEIAPAMTDCVGCHARPKRERAPSSRLKKFDHRNHQVDPVSSETLTCVRCHATSATATKVSQMRSPAMDACVECHQGQVAFDYTECLNCHGPKVAKQNAPKTHPAPSEANPGPRQVPGR